MIRLGRGFAESGRLGQEPMEQALETIGKVKLVGGGFQVDDLHRATAG